MQKELNKLIKTRYGQMVYNKNDELVGKSLEEYGEWMQAEMAFLMPYISSGGVCIDVGAYIGTHALFFANAVGSKGIVIAFEPEQIMYQLLSANISLNHYVNIRAFNCAVDETAGLVQITDMDYREPNNFAAASISRFAGYPIEARTIDDCSLPSVDLIKIDVSGWEPEAVMSASQTIRQHQPFIYARHLPFDQSTDLIQLIQSYDYDVYEHKVSGFNPKNFKKSSSDFLKDYEETNLFCVPKSKEIMVDELTLLPESN